MEEKTSGQILFRLIKQTMSPENESELLQIARSLDSALAVEPGTVGEWISGKQTLRSNHLEDRYDIIARLEAQLIVEGPEVEQTLMALQAALEREFSASLATSESPGQLLRSYRERTPVAGTERTMTLDDVGEAFDYSRTIAESVELGSRVPSLEEMERYIAMYHIPEGRDRERLMQYAAKGQMLVLPGGEIVGEIFARYRAARGISIEVLAGEIEMDPNTLGLIERGIRIPYARTMERYIANLQRNAPAGWGLEEADIATLRGHALPNPLHPALVRPPKVSVETARAFTRVINDCFRAMVPPINRSELARRLGCSPSYTTLLLNGDRVPSEEMIGKIRKALNITREDQLAVLQAYTEEHTQHFSGRSHASRARKDDSSSSREL